MSHKKIAKKAAVATKVLRQEGVLGFTIMSLQFVQKHTPSHRSRLKQNIYTKAEYEDVLSADFSKPLPDWPGTDRATLRFNWLMPPPGKGSGGHMTLFRFIKSLEDAGHECRIYFYSPGVKSTVAEVKASMGDSFPPLKATMEWLRGDVEMAPADGFFATSWETAYPIYASQAPGKRFYFVQDFEPFFYPVGSVSVLAENTYRMGFHGITAGGWLASKLHRDYGMQTAHFEFGADSAVYSHANDQPRKEVMFYARPYTERRGFEIGVMALDLFHRKHPDYTINFVGWDTSNYRIPFPYKNLKILEHHELNELYNRCAAGLVMSLTNMSLLPLELLSCGTIPVVNEGDNNRLVSGNPYIAYAQTNPMALAEALSAAVTHSDGVGHARKASKSVALNSWDESGKEFVSIVEQATRAAG